MKNLIKISLGIFLTITLFACSDDENQLNNENSVSAEKELFKKLEKRYDIQNIFKRSDNYTVIYNDGS